MSSVKPRQILVTSALPYANGPIHIGHLVEYIQTDVWVRYQKLLGHTCLYFCADDAHGTPVMLKAKQVGIDPEKLIETINKEHAQDFADFHIEFDQWHSTHSPENQAMVEKIWARLQKKNLIVKQTITQLYDPKEKLFLSDRMILGTCPKCQAKEQYGDACEKCGASYEPTQLLEPRSIFGTTPITRQTEHLFFDLAKLKDVIEQWIDKAQLQTAIVNKLQEWLTTGLKMWDISRDAPYFGFPIPDNPGKYFYVWLDAPIGYIAASLAWSERHQHNNEEFWAPDSPFELHHFIGKDIAYFHTLFWPALLHAADLRLPTRVHCHGFLTFNGQKMSKSRGTLVQARDWLSHFDAEYLRYYLTAKLNGGVEDIDFSLEDFQQRINADLIGNLFNIASRCSRLLHQYFSGKLSDQPFDQGWLDSVLKNSEELQESYAVRNTNRLIREMTQRVDQINLYLQEHKPWKLAKEAERAKDATGHLK